ncbi:MAG: 2,3,4,5-tetrahydropyridine-2,6-dicarboxylate N-succinyltransferase [Alphaproteobacteria bacterium]|nr:MAG: 2,3,4,5-tetrahydropyridine-2,6-dicarboxylate N-succinyltransferase [Alphaproteobacteria bacterium]
MSLPALESTINAAFDARDGISTATTGEVRDAVDRALDLLDRGEARVAERQTSGKWKVNQWLKKAVLLSFRLNDMSAISGAPGKASWWDKVPSKFDGWGENRFRDAGFRAVPGAIVRRSAYIAKNVVLMPSFVNLGAYVDESTMIDTWSTVGSCAQIGKRVHISGGVGIGGVLEPLQAEPVIVEDDCFIGEVPEYAVVVPGTLPARPLKNGQPGPSTACAVIVKRVDERTRAKTSINELLRD